MAEALSGIRVVDWSLYQVTPYAAVMLADMGAEVIHVEEREHGDLLRGLASMYGVDCIKAGRQINFEEHNRNKKSLAVDLKKPEGRQLIYDLVKKSDVFMTNFRQKAVDALGMDYKTLSGLNPRLIYSSSNGFGLKGPDSEVPSLDMVAQARAGAMLSGGEEGDPPAVGIPNAGDRTSSILIAYGVVVALLHRERGGTGQHLHVSQLNAMLNLQGYWMMPILNQGRPFARHTRSATFNPLYNYYCCGDGQWIIVGCLGDWYWKGFCRALDMPELETDPRFVTEQDRAENNEALIAIIDRVMAGKSRDEWVERFKSADLIFSVINSLSDLPEDPQVKANDYILDYDHPVLGEMRFPGFPVEFSKTPGRVKKHAPELGEDTEMILTEICGYSWEDVVRLKESKVIP
jgi:crotonobetainyl-CoA:carnitine CoA-transferase CaiB-like acyl-CoA transferase